MIDYIINTPHGTVGAMLFLVIMAIVLLKINTLLMRKVD